MLGKHRILSLSPTRLINSIKLSTHVGFSMCFLFLISNQVRTLGNNLNSTSKHLFTLTIGNVYIMNSPHPSSSLLSGQSSFPSHFWKDFTHIPISHLNSYWLHSSTKTKQNNKLIFIWAPMGQNQSSGLSTKQDPNQSPQLQRLARKLKYRL